jgi:hypothetical protein
MVAMTTDANDTPDKLETQRNQYTPIPRAVGVGVEDTLQAEIAQ